MDEIVIKVPKPFSGVADVGFTARYPEQDLHEPLRNVPFLIEGPAEPMKRLVERLALFTEKDHLVGAASEDEAYRWTTPVQLSDEVCVLAFEDRSLLQHAEDTQIERSYLWNLVRPLAFTFLRDCVRIGGLKLSDRIAFVVDAGHPPIVDLELERVSITPDNGHRLLFGY